MLINGKPVNEKYVHRIIDLLETAPRAFGNVSAEMRSYHNIPYDLNVMLHNAGFARNAYHLGSSNYNYEEARDLYRLSAQMALRRGFVETACISLILFADLSMERLDDYTDALEAYEQVEQLSDQHNIKVRLMHALTGKVLSTFRHFEYALCSRSGPHSRASMLEGLPALQKRLFDTWPALYGEPMDHEAHLVDQTEVGFSDKEKIGTSNIQTCVALAVWDPKTKKTALAHIDHTMRKTACSTLLRFLPMQGRTDGPLKVRLFGAKYFFNPDINMARPSHTTLPYVIEFLRDQPVDIVTADLFEPGQVSSIVVDPKDFSVREAVATAPNPNKAFFSLLMVAKDFPHLSVAFDLTQSKARRPVLFDPLALQTLQQQAFCKDSVSKYLQEDNNRQISPHFVAFTSTCFSPVRASYEEMCGRMEEHLKAQNAPDRLLGSVRHRALYLGEGAEEANKRLLNNRWANMRKRQMIPA